MSLDEEKQLLREERSGMEDLLQSREQDIEELNAEIKELKKEKTETIPKIQALCEEVVDLREQLDVYRSDNTSLMDQLQAKSKDKKICPFMSSSHISSCRNDCIAWDNEFGCVIMDSYKAVAQEWRYKE